MPRFALATSALLCSLLADKSAPRSRNFEFCFRLGRYDFANSLRGLMLRFVRRKGTRCFSAKLQNFAPAARLVLWKSRAVGGFGSAQLARLLSRGVESSGFKLARQRSRSGVHSERERRSPSSRPASSNRHSYDADSELPKIECEITASTLTHRSRNYSTSVLARGESLAEMPRVFSGIALR